MRWRGAASPSISPPTSAPSATASDFPARQDPHHRERDRARRAIRSRSRAPAACWASARCRRSRLLGRIRPAAVVGFGGYPTMPPVLAAALRRIPTVIHEQNAVMGRANRLLAPRVSAIATSFAGVLDREPELAAKATRTGNPVRPAVIAAAATALCGARIDGAAAARSCSAAARARASWRISCRRRSSALDAGSCARGLRSCSRRARRILRASRTPMHGRVAAEVAPFFTDLPARIAASHLVVSRSGASTVAELAAIGRPAILVPLPHALDQDQSANAGVLERAGGAIRLPQSEFTPERLAAEIAALASAPQKLVAMAAAARSQGAVDAAERLADLVVRDDARQGRKCRR